VAAEPVIAPTALEAAEEPSAYRLWWLAIVLLSSLAWGSAYYLFRVLATLV
jgi:hypothetical protein